MIDAKYSVALLIISCVDLLVGDPIVQLPNGLIQGRDAVTIGNKSYYAFEKIPYATPPVGNLRFKSPQPAQNWEGTLDTKNIDVICFQLGTPVDTQSEDCLYINVYTPQLPTGDNDPSLPVMLLIHGGAFVSGSSKAFKSDFIVEQDIIFATINYRLGPFGFLSTQDEVIPGNYGLKDQQLAIRWAHDNIKLFGGDPDKITIIGGSAGAISCAYHILNQDSKGLFRGAILESGSSLMPAAYQRNAREVAFGTAALIDESFSTNNDSQELLNFLLNVEARDLADAALSYKSSKPVPEYTEINQGLFWAPVIEVKNEDAFITKKMYGLLEAGNVVAVPILAGICSEESLGLSQCARIPDTLKRNLQAFDQHLDYLVPNDTRVEDSATRTSLGAFIRNIYTGGEPLVDHLGDGARYYSDTGFTRPIIKHAELYSKVAETYFYQFSYDGKLGGNDVHYDGADSVGHGEEGAYLFCPSRDCNITTYSEADQLTSQRLVALWTNFVKYLNPTPEPFELLQNLSWPVVSTENGDFLYVDIKDNLEIKNHPKEETYSKWIELYDSVNYTDFDTY